MDDLKTKQKRPSAVRAIKAKCHDCMGFGTDVRRDCEITTCSLYYWHPYKKKEPVIWFAGKVIDWEDAYKKAKREAE